ncbi:MAG: hypothetical protein LBK72_00690, partial [Bifidobacteriaceae bacterium]|nr:hypothetical protein [Bifidobacteriaceae bacterium]
MNNNTAITSLVARELYDSRGVPTIEVDVSVADAEGRCAAPFGAPGSRGEFEASAYGDLGVSGAVAAVNGEVGAALVGLDAADISGVDRALRELDGTANFEHLGGNTSSSISIASAVAAARALRQPLYRFAGGERAATLPIPLGNVIGGGAHALGPTPDMQEHLVLPVSSRTVREAVQLNIAVHEQAGRVLAARDPNFTGGSDDERAWAADLDDTAALEVIEEAAAQVSAQTGASFRLGLDLAADRFWDKADGVYRYQRAALTLTPAQQIDFVESLCDRFNLGYVEDPFESTDFASFAEL